MVEHIQSLSPITESSSISVLNVSAADLFSHPTVRQAGPPKLIITSPPYPGIHVLYHRWQVLGRREAPAPYWIANTLDGAGSKFYTLGDRKEHELKSYFENLRAAFHSISLIADDRTNIVQMVAFAEPEWQLPRYLEVMRDCGLREFRLPNMGKLDEHGRLWRVVPNRKWHADQNVHSPGSREVVLIHRKAAN